VNLDHYCPVQASIDSYCAKQDEEDFDLEVDQRKEALMNQLDTEDIEEAMEEVVKDKDLLKTIALAFRHIRSGSRVALTDADDIICGLYNAAERYTEQSAERQIKKEWQHKNDSPPEDNGDDD